jgi:hypothetical protein
MADIRVATTTTLTATPSVVAPSGSTTLTATIRPGFLIGPLGKVKFTDSNNGAALGTVKPGLQCILRAQPCIATLTVQASVLAGGDNTIVAAYSGGIFTKPSSGSTDVFVGTENNCTGSGECSTSATSSDGSTTTTINSPPPSSGTETVQAAFTTQAPPCPTVGSGDTLIYTVTNAPNTGTKTVTLTLTGAAADSEHENTDPDSFGNVCFGSPTSFATENGTADGGMAVMGTDGLYYGNLPLCDDGDGDNDYTNGDSGGRTVVNAPPCINNVDPVADTWSSYTPASGSTPSTYTEKFTTTASDPKAHG